MGTNDIEKRTKLLRNKGYSELVIKMINHAVPREAHQRMQQLLAMNETQVNQINSEFIVGR